MASGGADIATTMSKLLGNKRNKMEKDRPRFSARHRMHRSSVRPFFCCGSQISLNSITETKDMPSTSIEKTADDDYEDLTDSDDLLEDSEGGASSATYSNIKLDRPLHRSSRPLNTKRKKGAAMLDKSNTRKKFWSVKLRNKLQVAKQSHSVSESELSVPLNASDSCICTSYRHSVSGAEGGLRSSEGENIGIPESAMAHLHLGSSNSDVSVPLPSDSNRRVVRRIGRMNAPLPFINLNALYPINDIDEQLIAQRRFEMEHGIDVKDNADNADNVWVHKSEQDANSIEERQILGQYPSYGAMGLLSTEAETLVTSASSHNIDTIGLACSTLSLNTNPWLPNIPRPPSGVHTQVDYKHHLVPDLEEIINSSFYWGVMDRYQAEKLIENKAEGTFLLRDSAQDEFLFSVSFRRYGRSLHARIEQWNHKFSFDSRDPGVFAADSVCGLIKHYKDPSSCMFFEPMLTVPLHRNFPFSLQHITRATICTRIDYDGINQLPLPSSLKEYLRFYHFKQKVRVRRFDNLA